MTHYAKYVTPFGEFYIGYTDDAVTEFTNTPGVYEDIRSSLSDEAAKQLDEYFAGKRREFSLPLALKGTEFQMKVWKALLDIPYGEVRTYGEIARAVGNPKASRAVGMANHRNPIAIIVPCHRVVASGGIGGYGLGLEMKTALLALEGYRCCYAKQAYLHRHRRKNV
ncbi:MAG: methylated-DNA--[Clostridia bacterium]|nr:methylated-DNA--[protein]-cysteine S-methyltransferase [Clostridia bacterium]